MPHACMCEFNNSPISTLLGKDQEDGKDTMQEHARTQRNQAAIMTRSIVHKSWREDDDDWNSGE